jgi:hypothetical protein
MQREGSSKKKKGQKRKGKKEIKTLEIEGKKGKNGYRE